MKHGWICFVIKSAFVSMAYGLAGGSHHRKRATAEASLRTEGARILVQLHRVIKRRKASELISGSTTLSQLCQNHVYLSVRISKLVRSLAASNAWIHSVDDR